MEPLTPLDVQKALDAYQLGIQIQTFDESTATSAEAAAAIGTTLGSIVKSLVFVIEEQPIVVLAAGDQKIDTRKLAALYEVGRKKVKIASPEQCIEYVGYAPGGVPPLGHRQPLPIYIDATLQRFEMVYAAAGTPNAIFPIPFVTLVDISRGKVTDVIVDDEARPD
ncbi:MAG: YbaK/EbsC family protein [Anaerolineales bacterium]|nr:YbaK/EbsC family protein [Anaerolineales bacterium]